MVNTESELRQRKIMIPDDLWRAVQLVATVDSESAASVVRRALRADPAVSRALATLRSEHTA